MGQLCGLPESESRKAREWSKTCAEMCRNLTDSNTSRRAKNCLGDRQPVSLPHCRGSGRGQRPSKQDTQAGGRTQGFPACTALSLRFVRSEDGQMGYGWECKGNKHSKLSVLAFSLLQVSLLIPSWPLSPCSALASVTP